MTDTAPSHLGSIPGGYSPIGGLDRWVSAQVDQKRIEALEKRVQSAAAARDDSDILWAQDRILRASAYESGAVENLYAEGATQSVAMEVPGWEAELASTGTGAEQHFEDQLAAYLQIREHSDEYWDRPLTEADIRELHRVATQSQETYPVQTSAGSQQQEFVSGIYKRYPNHVINRAGRKIEYAPVGAVPPEMGHFIGELRTDIFKESHPVLQAAYMHWAIAHIHPFTDGNGRMARVIGSLPLFQHYKIPLVVFADRKRGYLQALEAADMGNFQEMVDYVSARVEDTFAWLAEILEASVLGQQADQSLADIRSLIEAKTGQLETRKEAAQRLSTGLLEALESETKRRLSGSIINGKVEAKETTPMLYFYGGNGTQTGKEVKLTLSADELARQTKTCRVQCGYTDNPHQFPVFAVSDFKETVLRFSLEDCSPDLSAGTKLRLHSFAETIVSRTLSSLTDDLKEMFKQHGRLPTDPGIASDSSDDPPNPRPTPVESTNETSN